MIVGVPQALRDDTGQALEDDDSCIRILLANMTQIAAAYGEDLARNCAYGAGGIAFTAQCSRPAKDMMFADVGNIQHIPIRWIVANDDSAGEQDEKTFGRLSLFEDHPASVVSLPVDMFGEKRETVLHDPMEERQIPQLNGVYHVEQCRVLERQVEVRSFLFVRTSITICGFYGFFTWDT